MARSGKGLPPEVASYFTGSDHRRQVEAAETRRAKHKVVKLRRRLDRQLIDTQDEALPHDVRKARLSKHTTGSELDNTRRKAE